MRRILLSFAALLSLPFRILPRSFRVQAIKLVLLAETRHGKATANLCTIFSLRDFIELLLNEQAMRYGLGQHPKHQLTNYHQFFLDNITKNSRILDLGCGLGFLASTLASALPSCVIHAVDYDANLINHAKTRDSSLHNLTYSTADITTFLPDEKSDYIILSNVLEHLNDRVLFLEGLILRFPKATLLIRVPSYQRHWEIPLRDNLGSPYLSDPDHKTEHTPESLSTEIISSGYQILSMTQCWGEIWSVCQPLSAK